MSRMCRCTLLLMLLIMCPFFGCGFGTAPAPTPVDSFQAVVFSDFHFNPFYDTTLFPALLAADPSQWASIFQTSAVTTPAAWGSDTNYPLLVLALSAIEQNLGTSPVVLYTGDLLGHNFQTTFFQLNGNPLPPKSGSRGSHAGLYRQNPGLYYAAGKVGGRKHSRHVRCGEYRFLHRIWAG